MALTGHTPTATEFTQRGPSPKSRRRYVAIDTLKAAAIITIVWIHTFQSWPKLPPPFILQLSVFTGFAVPAFFFASGFLLYQPAPISGQILRRRLRRVLIPYVVASLVATAGRWLVLGPYPLAQIAYELLTGSAVNIFYFVPMLVGAMLLYTLVSRFPRALTPVFVVFWITGLLCQLLIIFLPAFWQPPGDPFFWAFRDPLRWWGFYFAGCFTAAHVRKLDDLSQHRRKAAGLLLMGVVAALVAYAVNLPVTYTRLGGAIRYTAMYCAIGGIFLLSFQARERPWVRWLSEATYSIYLYHFFIISSCRYVVARHALPLALPALAINGLVFVIACIGSIAFVLLARRALGSRAQLIIG